MWGSSPARLREGRDARSAIRDAAQSLAAVSDTPRLDAELLLAHALGCTREAMLLGRLGEPTPAAFEALLGRRLDHEPVAYITGSREFWSLDFAVGPGALIPRPDSETLIEAALQACTTPPANILDLGTGPGTLLLAALSEWPEATGLGVDRSATALGFARRNAEALGLAERARFAEGNWGAGLFRLFDLILCNPPYVRTGDALPDTVSRHEPAEALFAGADGLADYRSLAPQISGLLCPGGTFCVEIGADQTAQVSQIFAASGLKSFPDKGLCRDLAGRDRCLVIHSCA